MQSHALSFDLSSGSWYPAVLPAVDSPRTLVIAFGAPELIDQPGALAQLAKHYPRSLIVGCSSAGEIHGATIRDRSLSVSVTKFDRTDLQLASLEVRSIADSYRAGYQLAKRLSARAGLRGVLVLSDGLHVNGSELIRGINSVLDDSVVVTGGLSGDGANFKRTWVSVGADIKTNVIAAVGFYGDHVMIGHGSKGGWDKFGPERIVTRSEGNVLYELDGRPALDLYKEYLGERAKDLPASGLFFPLSVRASTSDEKFVVRTVLGVDHENRSLTFAGDIPKGHRAQLMKANFESLIDGAGAAGSMTTLTGAPADGADSLVVAISCVGRRIVLGARTEEEVEAVRNAVRSDRACITGFYSYGEISPFATGHSDLHNQTMTLTVFSESATPVAHRLARGSSSSIEVTPTTIGSGFAVREMLYDAQRTSWDQPLPELDSPRTLVLAFGAPELADRPGVFQQLVDRYPRSLVIGCSSAGEIYGATVRDHSLAVTVTRFHKTELQLASLEVKSKADSYTTGLALAKRLSAKPGLRGVLVLSDGLVVNGSELIRGLNSVLDDSVVVTGGLSGDGANFKRTWVAVGAKPSSNVVAAVGFYGDHVTIGHGSKGGWDKFGPERIVTRSEGNVVYELDGRPALELYKEYLGERAKDLPASGLFFPLSVRASADDDKHVVRTVLAVDHAHNSLTFAGDIPKGYRAQLMKANFDSLIHGAGAAGSMTSATGAPPANADSLVVAISCVGRRIVLGARTEEEVEAVRDAVGSERARITGFYSYGEISPFATGHCDLHNQTMTLTVFSESPTPLARPALGSKLRARVSTAELAEPTQSIPSLSSPAPAPVAAPTGPTVRMPRTSPNPATIEVTHQAGVQVVKLRGRLTEAFKGEQLGRTLAGRVVFDLAEVDRVTSFGVREWLAMLSAATRMTESYFVRCSESIVNQLTMIRRFDGGARIVSFFAPYLCGGCGTEFERLLDCERDEHEIRSLVPANVGCPRCDTESAFDDDARSYLAFANGSLGGPIPTDVRSIHDALAVQQAPQVSDEVEKIVGDITRIRVPGKLSGQIRWRRILDGIEGGLLIDLSPITSSDATGIALLEQTLRALPPEVQPIEIEGAPVALLERVRQAGTARVRIVSAVVAAYCPSCAVHRPVTVHLEQYAADLAKRLPHLVSCKRCNGYLEMPPIDLVEPIVEPVAEASTLDATSRSAVSPNPTGSLPVASARPPSQGMSWKVVVVITALTGAVSALGVAQYQQRQQPRAVLATSPPKVEQPKPAAKAPSAPEPALGSRTVDDTNWHATPDVPPPWVERPFAITGDAVYVVGHGAPAVTAESALDAARAAASLVLVEQLHSDLAGTPVFEFVERRARRDVPGAAQAVALRFEHQHGKHVEFERVDLSTRKTGGGFETYARYKLPKAHYEQLRAQYAAVVKFRGVRVAALFPLLETSARASGDVVVIGVDSWVASDPSALREGDVILKVGAAPVATLDAFHASLTAAWAQLEPRMKLPFEVETSGARRAAVMTKPMRRVP